jgi:hypothetical protein
MNLELLKHKFATTERLRYLVDNEWRTSRSNRGKFPGGGGSQGRQSVIQASDGGAHS